MQFCTEAPTIINKDCYKNIFGCHVVSIGNMDVVFVSIWNSNIDDSDDNIPKKQQLPEWSQYLIANTRRSLCYNKQMWTGQSSTLVKTIIYHTQQMFAVRRRWTQIFQLKVNIPATHVQSCDYWVALQRNCPVLYYTHTTHTPVAASPQWRWVSPCARPNTSPGPESSLPELQPGLSAHLPAWNELITPF